MPSSMAPCRTPSGRVKVSWSRSRSRSRAAPPRLAGRGRPGRQRAHGEGLRPDRPAGRRPRDVGARCQLRLPRPTASSTRCRDHSRCSRTPRHLPWIRIAATAEAAADAGAACPGSRPPHPRRRGRGAGGAAAAGRPGEATAITWWAGALSEARDDRWPSTRTSMPPWSMSASVATPAPPSPTSCWRATSRLRSRPAMPTRRCCPSTCAGCRV